RTRPARGWLRPCPAREPGRRPAFRDDHLGGPARAGRRWRRTRRRGRRQREAEMRALLALPGRCRRRPRASLDLRPLHEQPVRRRRDPALRLMATPPARPATRAAGGPDAPGATGVPLGRWLLLALVVVILDQASKWAVLGRFEYGERLNLI